MKKFAPIAALVLIASLAGSAVADARGVCTVTPSPVSIAGGSFTVTASFAVPSEFYEITDQQKGHHKTDEARVWLGQADANGNVSADIPTEDGRIYGDGTPYALWPGDLSIKIVRYRTGGGGNTKASLLATCTTTVVD